MVNPSILNSPGFQQVDIRSRLLFHWRARDMLFGHDGGEIDLRTVYGAAADTFTRSSPGGLVPGHGGRLVGPHTDDVPRFEMVDWDGDGVREEVALRLEGQRTNELTRSEELDHADWSTNGLSARNADQASDPKGGETLDELVENTGTSTHVVQQTKTVTADANYALSVWAIANTRTDLRLEMKEAAASANHVRAYFDLSAGAVGTTSAGGTGAFVRAYVLDYTDVADGLYRCVLVGSVGNAATSIQADVALSDGTDSASYTGDGSSSLYAGFAQLEDQAEFASSYVPTVGSAVTRNAEDAVFDYLADPQVMTLYLRLKEHGTHLYDGSAPVYYAQIGNSGQERIALLGAAAADGFRVFYDDGSGSSAQASITSGLPNIGDGVELRAVLDADAEVTLGLSIDEGAEATASSSGTGLVIPDQFTTQSFYLGRTNAGLYGHTSFLEAKVAPGVKTMAEMRALL